jgi:hypothetical protein
MTTHAAAANYLSTDWFANADGMVNRASSQALQNCWSATMTNRTARPTTSTTAPLPANWLTMRSTTQLRQLFTGVPSMQTALHALESDEVGFRAFFDVAILVAVDHCYGNGHMAHVASTIRSAMSRPDCISLKPGPSYSKSTKLAAATAPRKPAF